jgi:hypothetical protein
MLKSTRLKRTSSGPLIPWSKCNITPVLCHSVTPSSRAAPPVKGQDIKNTGRGLCLVKSSTKGETQSLRARRGLGGLDRDTKRAVSLDDVIIDVTEIVSQPLESANGIRRAEENTEAYIEEIDNATEIVMNELTAQFKMSGQNSLNSLSAPVWSGMSWIRVLRRRRQEGEIQVSSTMYADNGEGHYGGYYVVLGNSVTDAGEDGNMVE